MAEFGDRLKALRTAGGLTQAELSRAIVSEVQTQDGKPLSTSTISAWENGRLLPSDEQIEVLARLLAVPVDKGATARLLKPAEVPEAHREAVRTLQQELLRLRQNGTGDENGHADEEAAEPLPGKMFSFPDGEDICVITSKLPPDRLKEIPFTDEFDPNYIELLTFADADSLVEVFGHLRAMNPRSRVTFGTMDKITNDQLQQHLVVLGGDWNQAATWALRRTELPIDFQSDNPSNSYFVVGPPENRRELRPTFRRVSGGKADLEYDIALFARGPNPANTLRTLTFCLGLFSRGTYGAVRAFTDTALLQQNEVELAEISEDFGAKEFEWLMFRVQVIFGRTMTPDLSRDYQRLVHGVQESAAEGLVPRIDWLQGAESAPVVSEGGDS